MKLKTSAVAICNRFELLKEKNRTQTHNTEFEAKQSQSQNIDEQKKHTQRMGLDICLLFALQFFFSF